MYRFVIVVVCAYALAALGASDAETGDGNAREEKLRSGLIDAFQTIKKASAKGGIDDEGPLTSDLTESMTRERSRPPPRGQPAVVDDFDLLDDDGLTFAEAFGDVQEDNRLKKTTEKSHNVQHIVKTTKKPEKTTAKPSDSVINKISDSIRSAVNETRNNLQLTAAYSYPKNDTKLIGIDEVLRVFDAGMLVEGWPRLRQLVSGECREDLQSYVEGLSTRKLWALKSK
ncbi:hypothetical protein EVAR_17830_1 [Eumeta japonica]|uniref:Uncharacterized protein n=1 Tax=Eumeta variegata TaxID=151549 RepID=A0A4C1TU70_EUMVA|nr:hypothetical protein EVAR_17830_1 [Eumeta japonica]